MDRIGGIAECLDQLSRLSVKHDGGTRVVIGVINACHLDFSIANVSQERAEVDFIQRAMRSSAKRSAVTDANGVKDDDVLFLHTSAAEAHLARSQHTV